jgi:phage RecT family recombinase
MTETRQELALVCRSVTDADMQAKIKQVLPASVSIDRFTRVTLTAIQNNPAVLDGDRGSLYSACLEAAKRGLLPDGKQGALVIFNTKDGDQWVKRISFLPMVEGIIAEMAKAGVKAYATSVYANDEIKFKNDDKGQHVEHIPVVFGERGARLGAFACGTDKDGTTYVEAMSADDIEKVRARSKQRDKQTGAPKGTWLTDPERMEQKSALHRLRKRIPLLSDDDFDTESEIEYAAPTQPAAGTQSVEPSKEGSSPATSVPASAPPGNGKHRPKALQAVVDHANKGDPDNVQEPPTSGEPDMFTDDEDIDL